MLSWANLLSQTFNGLVVGALLALISSGLTIIYGTLSRVLNLAHGAMFMVGGYAGVVAYHLPVALSRRDRGRSVFRSGSRRPDGAAGHQTFLRTARRGSDPGDVRLGDRLRRNHPLVLGSLSQSIFPPSWAEGVTSLGFMIYPTYRLAVVGIIAVALLALYLVLYRSRLGMIVRAGIEIRSWSIRSASRSCRCP